MPIKKKPNKFSPPFNIILLGDPGAGKATQGAVIAKKYGMLDYDMGRELTLLRERSKSVDKAQKLTADRGILTPTKIVRQLNRDTLLRTPSRQGILFDGHPKMLGEAKIVRSLFKKTKRTDPLVLYLKIPQSEVIKRIQKRKGYYNTKYNQRADDSTAALKNRAKYYRKNIAEVVDFYKSNYQFQYIDGLGSKAEVAKRIQAAIDGFTAK